MSDGLVNKLVVYSGSMGCAREGGKTVDAPHVEIYFTLCHTRGGKKLTNCLENELYSLLARLARLRWGNDKMISLVKSQRKLFTIRFKYFVGDEACNSSH